MKAVKKVGKFVKRNWLGLTAITAGVAIIAFEKIGMQNAADAVAEVQEEIEDNLEEMEVE